MVYIYLPAAYYHLNLEVAKENLLTAGFSAVPAVFLVADENSQLLPISDFHYYTPTKPWQTNMLNDVFFLVAHHKKSGNRAKYRPTTISTPAVNHQ